MMKTDNWGRWFGEKWMKSFLVVVAIFGIIVAGGVVVMVEANSYNEVADFYLRKKEVAPYGGTAMNTWQECQAHCQSDPQCQMFEFKPVGNQLLCYRYENTIAYGRLGKQDAITGQLDSPSPNATLAWLGIGFLDPGNVYMGYFYRNNPENISRAECAAACEAASALSDDAQCASYKIADVGTGESCYAYDFTFNELPDEPSTDNSRVGIRSDLSFSQTAVIGDTLNTRVAAADLPSAPPNLGAAVPAYTEVPYHYEYGTSMITSFYNPHPFLSSWQECSILCHRNATCKAFQFEREPTNPGRCRLFDVVIFGKLHPGYSKYGIIDRSGPEGAVSSLLPVAHGDRDMAYRLFTYKSVTNMDDCAKRCYDFYQPKVCAGFFFNAPNSECQLYDATVPGAVNGSLSLPFFFTWDPAKYRYGFIDGRLPSSLLEGISCFYGISFTGHTPCRNVSTTEPPTTTPTTTPTAGRRNGDVQIFTHKPGKMVQSVAPLEVHLKSRSGSCALECHVRVWCVSYDYNEVTKECRLFEASIGGNNLMANASTQYAVSGGVYHPANGN